MIFDNNTVEQFWLPVTGTEKQLPVTVINGAEEGKTAIVSAGIHSREYTGIEAAILLSKQLRPEIVHGRVIIIHCCNYDGFLQLTNDTVPEDGKNLNKVFPGDENGSASERIAAFISRKLLKECDYLIDLHSGGGNESLIPHAYYQCTAEPAIVKMSKAMSAHADMPCAVGSRFTVGLFSHAAKNGIPSVLLERGQYGVWSEKNSQAEAEDVMNILRYLGVVCDDVPSVKYPQNTTDEAYYEKAQASGCWYPAKKPGECITKGEKIGEIRDVFGQTIQQVYAKKSGVILYETSSLAITAGSPMIAYGVL